MVSIERSQENSLAGVALLCDGTGIRANRA